MNVPSASDQNWPYQVPGIPDERFQTGDLPMTKLDVRVLSVSRLRPAPDHIVWDVGAGSGSVAVESAFAVPDGSVHAVEKREEGVELIQANRKKFSVPHLHPHHGEAPAILDELPDPDRIFIGGSGGRMEDIIDVSYDRLPEDGRLVVNAITMNTISTAFQLLNESRFDLEDICSVSVNRNEEKAGYQFMKARNQIYIMSAVRKDPPS